MAKPLKLDVLLGAIDKATGPLKAITQGSSKTAQALKASRDQLRDLERAQKDLRGFRELKQQARQTSTALEEQQREIRDLSRALQNAEGDTSELTRKRDAAIRQARKLKERYEGEQQQLHQLRTSMHRVEGVTGSFSDQQRELQRRIQQANQELQQQQQELSEVARRQRAAADAAKKYQQGMGRAGAVSGAGAAGLAAGGVALTAVTSQAFSNQISGARIAAQNGEGAEQAKGYRDVIQSVYSSGRGSGLEEIATTVGVVSSAFGSLSDQTQEDLAALATQAQALADVFGTDVAESSQTAAILVQNGLAKDATAALDLLGAGFQQVSASMRDELPEILHEYSTNFRALGFDGPEAMNLLVAAAEQGKFALDKTGDALKEFTIRGSDMSTASVEAYEVIGLNAKQMSNAIASGGPTAREALQATARALLDVQEPARQANLAIALFGTPIEDLSVDQIPRFLEALTGTEDSIGDVTGAVDRMTDTLGDNAGSALKNVTRVLSSQFMTVLDDVQDEIIAVSRAVTGWIKENPELASTLTKAAAAIAVLVAVGGSLLVVLGSVLGPIAAVRYALTLLALNPATLTIMGIVAAVAALAAGAYLVYRNWDRISAWFGQRWAEVKAAFDAGIGGITRLLADWSPLGLLWKGITDGLSAMGVEVPTQFTTLGSAIVDGLFGGMKAVFDSGWGEITAAFGAGIEGVTRLLLDWSPIGLIYRGITAGLSVMGVELPASFTTFGSAIIDGIIGGVTGGLSRLGDTIAGMGEGIKNWFKDALGINSPSRVFAGFGANLLEGLINGIDAGWQTLKGTIGNTADAVVGWFKDKLGINSPSRVFAELGIHTIDGLSVGLDRQRDEPAKRVRDIAQRVRQAGAGIALGAVTLPAAALPINTPIINSPALPAVSDVQIDRRPALSSPTSNAQPTGDTITINVYGAPGQDTATLAREINRLLEERDRSQAARRRSSLRDID